MVNGTIKKAYLLQKTDKSGAWVDEGDDFVGWRVQSITTDAAKLQKRHTSSRRYSTQKSKAMEHFGTSTGSSGLPLIMRSRVNDNKLPNYG